MKQALTESKLLAYPRFEQATNFIIATDASNVGIGGWLSQEVEGERRQISFFSRTLTSAELNYSTNEKEALKKLSFAPTPLSMWTGEYRRSGAARHCPDCNWTTV